MRWVCDTGLLNEHQSVDNQSLHLLIFAVFSITPFPFRPMLSELVCVRRFPDYITQTRLSPLVNVVPRDETPNRWRCSHPTKDGDCQVQGKY